MNAQISNCCGAKVKVSGGTTNHYICRECLEPCDLAIDEDSLDIHPIFK